MFRHQSAQARCCKLGRVLQVHYSGAISRANFRRLDAAVLPWRQGAAVALERMDLALTLVGDGLVSEAHWPVGTPASVVIVRPDQYDYSQRFCRELGQRGIIRMTFLASQTALALALVERMAS